jgi:predicted nuclease with TOPRIM domain
LEEAYAEMMDSLTAKMRHIDRSLERMEGKLTAMTADIRRITGEQALLGNRVESAFCRALRTNIRLDEIEDAKDAPRAK